MSLVPSLEQHRREFSARINDVVEEIDAVLSLENHSDHKKVDICARAKANAYVALSAAQEYLVSEAFLSCVSEIGVSGISGVDLKPCIFSVFLDSQFISIASQKSIASWIKRLEILDAPFRSVPLQSATAWPSDGKTIKPDHYALIWRVLDLPGVWYSDPTHPFAVTDLCIGRNAVAHGRMSRNAFGRSKICSDVLKLTRKIEEVGENYLLNLDHLIVSMGYKR